MRLNRHFGLAFLEELIALKTVERATADRDGGFHAARLAELESRLDRAYEESGLPDERDRQAVNELLVRLRLG